MATEAQKWLALTAASVLLSLIVAEGVVRIIEPRAVLREFFETSDHVFHHRLIPNARGRQKTTEFDAVYAINAFGLRSPEIAATKPAGVKRLLLLGDSFTEGVGVQASETYARHLQAALDGVRGSERWEVINAVVASYSPLLEYLFLKNRGLTLDPDVVILALDLSDFFDDIQYSALARFDDQGEPIAVTPPTDPVHSPAGRALVGVKDFLKYNTRTYNFVCRRLASLLAKRSLNFSGDVALDKYGALRGDPSALDDRSWWRTYDYLQRIHAVLKARDIEFWIAVYPYGLQISAKEWNTGRLFWGFEVNRVYSSHAQELVEAFGRRHGIHVVNMVSDFQEAARTTFPLYYDNDGHWRAAGHQVAAPSLYKALTAHMLQPEGAGTPTTVARSSIR